MAYRTPAEVLKLVKAADDEINIDPEVLACLRKMYDPITRSFRYFFMPVGETRRGLELACISKDAADNSKGDAEIALLRNLFRRPLTYQSLFIWFKQEIDS